jgi:tetratricopeptide (TPR) repeat protein
MKKFTVCAGVIAMAVLSAFLLTANPRRNEEALWRHRNLGKAFFETPTTLAQAPAELKKALDLAPNSFRDRLNYGLALLRAGDIDQAIAELELAQKQDPKQPHTWFNLGIAYKRKMRYEDAIRQFQRMTQLVPDEPMAYHNLGLLHNVTDHPEEALQYFKKAASLDSRLVASRLQIYNYYRLNDDDANAQVALADFRRVKEEQQAVEDTEDVEWSFYAELYDPVVARPALRETAPAPALKFENRALPGLVNAASAGSLVMDADGDGVADLLVWSRDGVRLFRSGATLVNSSGLEGLTGIRSAAAGDFDNDGAWDLCVVLEDEVRLFRNVKGRFEASPAELPSGKFNVAVWLDFDHDYDLDLFLLGEKSRLLRNEGPSGFADFTSRFPFVEGTALSAVAFRVIPDTKAMDLVVSYAGRSGVVYRDGLRGSFRAEPLNAVPAGARELSAADLDADSYIDLVYSSAAGVGLAANRDGRFAGLPVQASGAVVLADLENRGLLDVVAGKTIRRNQAKFQFTAARTAAALPEGVAWTSADFDGDGRTDLAAVASDGTVRVLFNRTVTGNNFLAMSLEGMKNMKSAAATEVEIKAGEFYDKRLYQGVPLVFGVGKMGRIDTVRITWANAMIQNETNQTVNRTVRFKEAPRLAGSCPMVFAWNGREFQFITDVLGVAPLGAGSGDGNFFPVDHKEYVRIPENTLVKKDGHYEIRITEELHEVAYLDQIRLIAVDHPEKVQIFTNDKFKAPPFPEFRLFGARQRLAPLAARDSKGRSVLPQILRQDGVYAGASRHNHAGVAELHALEIELPKGPNTGVLFLNGWVDWADGSTFVGAAQSEKTALVFPYLQVKDAGGQWRTVIDDMGIPAGKPKTIAVDLTGKFLSESRHIRIVTNLALYWDEIFFDNDHSAPEVSMTSMDPAVAELRLRGFSRPVIDPQRRKPEWFDYARWTPHAVWDQTPGMYTRYGDVRELLLAAEDRFVIMGAGDELTLRFDPTSLPTLRAGWRRDYLLFVDGWAKDSDANTAFSQTVEPLPFHGMSRYPYPESESYPDTPAHRAYREQYNTRPAMKFVAPMVAGRR